MTTATHTQAFVYLAIRPGGGRKLGMRQAGSVPALAQSLRVENQLLVKTWPLPSWAAREHSLNLTDQAELNDQIAQLLSRGVPLVETLDVVAQTVRPGSKPIIVRMRDLVASGTSFADACKSVGVFDNVTIAVYRGAERSGDLSGAAKELAQTARRRLAIKNKSVTVLMYPAITLSVALIVACVLMLYVVPMMADGLKRVDIPLPWFSRLVMGTGQWMRDHIIWLLVALAVVLAMVLAVRVLVARAFGVVMRKTPVMRDLIIAQESARFFSVMAAMTRTGVPIADALGVANQVIGHPDMKRQLERLRTRLIEGGLLRQLIDEVTTLPLATRRLLVAAERAGDMESAFGTLAQDMTEQVDRTSTRLVSVIEPLAIVMLFVVIGTLIAAIMLPMLTMTNQIRL